MRSSIDCMVYSTKTSNVKLMTREDISEAVDYIFNFRYLIRQKIVGSYLCEQRLYVMISWIFL